MSNFEKLQAASAMLKIIAMNVLDPQGSAIEEDLAGAIEGAYYLIETARQELEAAS